MSDHYTEEEDKLVNWFKDNFKNMIIGIIAGASFVLGLNYYSDTKLNEQYEISLKFSRIGSKISYPFLSETALSSE